MFGIVKGKLTDPFNDFGYARPKYRWVWKTITGPTGDPMRKRDLQVIPGEYVYHKGIDIGNGDGLSWAVHCPCLYGVVRHVNKYKTEESWWPSVVVIEDIKNVGYFHLLGHLDHAMNFKVGDGVFAGTVIGYTASTDTLRKISPKSIMRSHLHYEIFKNFKAIVNKYGQSEVVSLPKWPQDYCDPFDYLQSYSLSHGKAQAVTRSYPETIS